MSLTLSSSTSANTSNALAVDARSLNKLKFEAGQNSAQATNEAAKQFESLFMREMIKSMREATMKSGLLEGAQGDLGTDLLDQQLSVNMSGRPGGLSEAIARQLSQQMGGGDVAISAPSTLSLAREAPSAAATASATRSQAVAGTAAKGRDNFVQHHGNAAERVAQDSGIPASFMLGQAGHETGWGKSEIKNADGSSSFNLFGIKAGKNWSGKVAEVTTTEYVGGVPRKVTAKFRAYDSYEASFRDYAKLINNSPRYEKARANTGSSVAYAAALQKAGYATDPAYASKLSGAIQSALRAQRAQA
jgi:flagellar protein FlgJ